MIRPFLSLAALFTFMVTLLPGMELFAQDNVTQGSVIQELKLAPGKDGATQLMIQGIFNTKELDRVRVRQKAGSTKMTLVLPNSLADVQALGGLEKKFAESPIVKSIQLEESLSGESGAVVYQTTLTIHTNKVLRGEIHRPIKEDLFQITLVDASTRSSSKNMFSPRALKSSRDRQEKFSAERQQELEKQKEKSLAKAKDDASIILKKYQKPVVMQLSIINGTGHPKKGYQLSVFLSSMQKKDIEQKLGLKLDVVNIANAKRPQVKDTTIFYKENYLKAALLLAKKISGEQKVVPMLKSNQKIGIDVEIYLGTDYR